MIHIFLILLTIHTTYFKYFHYSTLDVKNGPSLTEWLAKPCIAKDRVYS